MPVSPWCRATRCMPSTETTNMKYIQLVISALRRVCPPGLINAGLAAVSAPQAQASGGTGTDQGNYWSLYYSGGYATQTFPNAGTYPGNFQLNWSGVGDVVGGKGWNPGGYRTMNYNVGVINGYNFFGCYGWTTSPLIEYYVCELGSVTYNATYVGSLSSDGHNYAVYY